MKLVASLLSLALTAAGPSPIIVAGGGWAAIDRGAACEALSRSLRVAAKGKVQANAGFAFTPDHRRWGEFHARLSRVPRPGSSVMLDDRRRSRSCWWRAATGRGAAARCRSRRSSPRRATATAMRVEARDGARAAVHRSLCARRRADRDRCRGRALRPSRRWQNPAEHHLDSRFAMSADTALMPIPGPSIPCPFRGRRSARADGRVELVGLAQGADPRRARGRRAGAQAGQASRQADLALDLQSRRQRFRGDERHRQGAAAVVRRALRHLPAGGGRGAGVVRRHPQMAAEDPRRP